MSDFLDKYKRGRVGESLIASWFRRRGKTVLPVYDKMQGDFKGPTLFLPDETVIAPDMLVFNSEGAWWIEAKYKTAFTWHRKTGRWVTGIDLRNYSEYRKVNDQTPWPVWLLFLHEGGKAKDSPDESPSGLFGNEMDYLVCHENHRHDNWGRSGMVYWSVDNLKKLAVIGDVVLV